MMSPLSSALSPLRGPIEKWSPYITKPLENVHCCLPTASPPHP